jgi:hypothetical protein
VRLFVEAANSPEWACVAISEESPAQCRAFFVGFVRQANLDKAADSFLEFAADRIFCEADSWFCRRRLEYSPGVGLMGDKLPAGYAWKKGPSSLI